MRQARDKAKAKAKDKARVTRATVGLWERTTPRGLECKRFVKRLDKRKVWKQTKGNNK